MAEMKGPRYEKLLKTLENIDTILRTNVFYIMRGGEQAGPFLVEDLDMMLTRGTAFETDLAWYSSFNEWQPLSSLIRSLENQGLLPPPSRKRRFRRWMVSFLNKVMTLFQKSN